MSYIKFLGAIILLIVLVGLSFGIISLINAPSIFANIFAIILLAIIIGFPIIYLNKKNKK